MAQSYSGDISDYSKPGSAQAGQTINIIVNRAYVRSDPQQTVTVYAILYDATTGDQLNFTTKDITANGTSFKMSSITTQMPNTAKQAYSLELWLYNPPGKSGWHNLCKKSFSVTQSTSGGNGGEQSYSGDITEYEKPNYCQAGYPIKVTIKRAYVKSSPEQSLTVYALLYDRDSDTQLDSTTKNITANGSNLSMSTIGTEMPNINQKQYSIELWLYNPPGKSGWHQLCHKSFTVKKGTQESGYQYGGRIRKYSAPEEVSGDKNFSVDITDAVFNANPIVNADVYGILKNANGEQLGDQMVNVRGDGQGFTINNISGRKDDSDSQRFNLEMWLRNPPGKSGWHKLDAVSFTVKKKKTLLPEIPLISDFIPPPF